MRLKKYLAPIIIQASLLSTAFALPITNKINGVGPADAPIRPYLCLKKGEAVLPSCAVKPGDTADANQCSGNKYWAGADIRFGGCEKSDSYLGFLGINANSDNGTYVINESDYQPPKGVHIALKGAAIDSSGNITGNIQYTPIETNTQLGVMPKPNGIWEMVGINLSGLEFGKAIDPGVIPNLSQADADSTNSDLAEIKSFIAAGMNTIRVPISWGFLQLEGPGVGGLNLDYFNSYVKPLLETLTTARVNTIVDLHAYMHYSKFGKEYSGCMQGVTECPGGTLVTDTAVYQKVWLALFNLIKNDPRIDMNYISLDLMNEPVNVPDDLVFTIQTDLIKMLRQNGFKGYILVEGNAWSGLHSWAETQWKSRDGQRAYTNATLFTRQNFEKAGISDLDKIIINVHQYFDKGDNPYSGTGNVCFDDLNSQGPGGLNVEAFNQYLEDNHLKAIVTEFGAGTNSASCSNIMNNFLYYLAANSAKQKKDSGFIGWTIWSAGHGWGDYPLRVTPTSYQMNIMQPFLNK